MVVIHNLLNGDSWSISTVCCWCNDTYYVLLGLYDDFSCWLSFARLARIHSLYCCCNCNFIFYISILSRVIQVCSILKHNSLKMRSSRQKMTKIRSFVCELDLWSFREFGAFLNWNLLAYDNLRFYYNVGRYEDGRKSLQKFAKNTKTELSDEYLDYFESNLRSEKEKSQQSNSQTTYRNCF